MSTKEQQTLLAVLNLSDRALEHLGNADITTVEALRKFDRQGLIDLQGIGATTADQILLAIAAYDQAQEALEVELAEDEQDQLTDLDGSGAELLGEAPMAEGAIAQAIDGLMTDPKDDVIRQLTETLRWAEQVLRNQGRGRQGMSLAGMIRQSVLLIRPELTDLALAEVPAKLAMDD
jgi:hypothetical protein